MSTETKSSTLIRSSSFFGPSKWVAITFDFVVETTSKKWPWSKKVTTETKETFSFLKIEGVWFDHKTGHTLQHTFRNIDVSIRNIEENLDAEEMRMMIAQIDLDGRRHE